MGTSTSKDVSDMDMPMPTIGMRRSRAMAVEHVTDGHPDKVCDQMADTIVTEALKQDLAPCCPHS